MVTRKPVTLGYRDSQGNASRPHPASPSLDDNQHPYLYGGLRESEVGDGWENVETAESHEAITLPAGPGVATDRLGRQQVGTEEGTLPSSLRIRHPEATPGSSFGTQSSEELFPRIDELQESDERKQSPGQSHSTNPFYRARSSDKASGIVFQLPEESSVNIWADLANYLPPPTSAPPPPPIDHELNGFSEVSLEDHGSYHKDQGSEPWSNEDTFNSGESPLISFESAEQYSAEKAGHPSPFVEDTVNDQSNQTGWIDNSEQKSAPLHSPGAEAKKTDANLQDQTYSSFSGPSNIINGFPTLPPRQDNTSAPELPPRKSQEEGFAPPQPPRPFTQSVPEEAGRNPRSQKGAEITHLKVTKQRSETYQIKHVRWTDSSGSTIISPIMVQNANGPCPLLALVNALTLSTHRDTNTALVETLRVREQVSLGLLLDAVFDELMSGRRGDAAQEIPDVGELYSFLVTLHTGMNVNPRFIQLSNSSPNLIDIPDLDASSTSGSRREPGGFEETKEMKLYSTFSVPLIHGWLPPQSHPAYAALQRSASTYEDAQNLMFREEELEDKLQQEGLKQDEQILLEDIASIKYFLSSSATQLTGYGLDTITDTLHPGSIAILFRNDHFSTLYKHPRTGRLLTLVTDMGYAGHDEVVWESLVDVSGEGSEFFAGDFRPVGNNANDTYTDSQHTDPANTQPWSIVSRHNRSLKIQNTQKNSVPQTPISTTSNPQRLPTPPHDHDYNLPTSPTIEQEDHDLALALQLQEEEEDRSRRESAARRREDELSQAYLESQVPPTQRSNAPRGQNHTVRPMVPPRGGSNVVNASRRPAPRADPEAGEDAPPPSYEQAAKSQPYHPPADEAPYSPPTPINRTVSGTAPRSPPQSTRPRQMSAYSQHASSVGNLPSTQRRSVAGRPPSGMPTRGGLGGEGIPGIARRRSAGVSNSSWEDDVDKRDKDCIIM